MAITGRFVNVAQGYAITLPQHWLRLDLESDMGQFLREAILADPALADLCPMSDPEALRSCLDEQAASLEADLVSLAQMGAQIGFDLTTLSEPVPTMVVITVEPAAGLTADLLLTVGPAGLRSLGVTGRIRSGLLELPAGTAVYFYYRTPADIGENGVARQFHLVANDQIVTVIVAGHRSDDGLSATADELLQSLEVLD